MEKVQKRQAVPSESAKWCCEMKTRVQFPDLLGGIKVRHGDADLESQHWGGRDWHGSLPTQQRQKSRPCLKNGKVDSP